MRTLFILLTLAFLNHSAFSQGSGRMLDFNGSTSYVDCGFVNLSTSTLTLQGWVKVDAFKSAQPYISSLFGTEKSGAQAMLRLGDGGISAQQVQFVLYINRTHYKLASVSRLTANKWYHIAATYDGASMKIYIDGVLDATRAQTGTITSNNIFEIGRNYADSRILDGQIDEVSVFKAALSQATIRDYMCKSINSSHPNYSALEGYWKMDKASGNLTDHSGKGHTGTLRSSPLKQFSSAPIGNESVHNYGSPASIYLSHPDGDSIRLSSISGNPTAVHVYRINGKSNATTFPASSNNQDTSRYWGVHYVGGSNPRSSVNYYFLDNSFYKSNASCFVDLATRTNNSVRTWTAGNASQSNTNLALTAKNAGEYLLTFATNKSIHKDSTGGVCIGDSLELENTTSGFSYQWYKDGQALTNDTTNKLKVHQAGKYELTISFNGCTDTSNSFVLTVGQKPNVSLSAFTPICFSNHKFHTLSGGMPAGGKYENPNISGPLFVTANAGAGDHKIVYRYTGANGCADTASQILKVHPLPTVTLDPFGPVCADSGAFSLSGGLPAGGNYFVNGATNSSFDAVATGVGNHKVSYIYVDNNNCTDTASQTVSVVALPTVSFKFPKNRVCEGADQFPINGANPTGGVFSGTGVSGFNFNPKSSGVGAFPVQYNYTDRTTGCKNTATDTMNVTALPAPPTITQANGELSASAGASYQWYDKDGPIVGETKQTYKPLRSGLYRASVTVGGCTSEVSAEFDFDKTLSVKEALNSGISIYPNPSNGVITVKGDAITALTVFDLSGKILLEKELAKEQETTVNISALNPGTYLVAIENAIGETIRTTLIMQ